MFVHILAALSFHSSCNQYNGQFIFVTVSLCIIYIFLPQVVRKSPFCNKILQPPQFSLRHLLVAFKSLKVSVIFPRCIFTFRIYTLKISSNWRYHYWVLLSYSLSNVLQFYLPSKLKHQLCYITINIWKHFKVSVSEPLPLKIAIPWNVIFF